MTVASQRHTTSPRLVEQLQIAMRSPDALDVPFEYAIARARECRTLGDAIKACAAAAGLDLDKQVSEPLRFDKAQLSRWESGQEGIKWEKLKRIMDWCGNVIPILWMNIQAGFDPYSLRIAESHAEKIVREANERAATQIAEANERAMRAEIKAEVAMQLARKAAA